VERWIAYYKDHYRLKKNRLIKIDQEKGRCEQCKQPANKVKHIDSSRDNHDLSNLKLLCNECFGEALRSIKKVSKYRKLYGFTLDEMVKRWGKSSGYYFYEHRKGTLKDILRKKKNYINNT